MNKEQFKKQLEQEIKKTQQTIQTYEDMSQPVSPDNAIGRISRMDAINNKSITESALRNAREKLNKLQLALSNIDNPEFGLCRKCHKPIPEGRILLKPESPYCVNCAQ
ncbi:MAG: TraR/DksA C4-type zinc finger protein [Algoriphagus sp.]|nr:TraR/DksA C4-type zinc finger protein [Algoriphagus sp.]